MHVRIVEGPYMYARSRSRRVVLFGRGMWRSEVEALPPRLGGKAWSSSWSLVAPQSRRTCCRAANRIVLYTVGAISIVARHKPSQSRIRKHAQAKGCNDEFKPNVNKGPDLDLHFFFYSRHHTVRIQSFGRLSGPSTIETSLAQGFS